jgi:D-sedoheptulose 7-phosphate isomerase
MFTAELQQHIDGFERLKLKSKEVEGIGTLLSSVIETGGKIMICGNGGSASDAQHFAAELIGRFEQERQAWPAVALTTDTSILTAIGNDYGFDNVFSRQVQGLGSHGDALVGISTSGNSQNVLQAISTAKALGIKTVGLLGGDGGAILNRVDQALVIEEIRTARIQEAHSFILHFWAGMIETHMCSNQ